MSASRVLPVVSPAAAHEHAWATDSVHATSEGRVRYVHCTGCVARRVDLDPAAPAPAFALSRAIGALGDGAQSFSPAD